jgi:hypothetical protein
MFRLDQLKEQPLALLIKYLKATSVHKAQIKSEFDQHE